MRGGRNPGTTIALLFTQSGAAAYYADSAGMRPGRWVLSRSGDVDPRELAAILAGRDPSTGEPLISARGSAGTGRAMAESRPHAEAPRPGVALGSGGGVGARALTFLSAPVAPDEGRRRGRGRRHQDRLGRRLAALEGRGAPDRRAPGAAEGRLRLRPHLLRAEIGERPLGGGRRKDAHRNSRRARRGGGGGPPLHGAPRLQGRDPEEATRKPPG